MWKGFHDDHKGDCEARSGGDGLSKEAAVGALASFETFRSEFGHPEAIDLFKLNVQIYPDSGDAESYKKSLEKSPMNENAKAKLKELEAKAQPVK